MRYRAGMWCWCSQSNDLPSRPLYIFSSIGCEFLYFLVASLRKDILMSKWTSGIISSQELEFSSCWENELCSSLGYLFSLLSLKSYLKVMLLWSGYSDNHMTVPSDCRKLKECKFSYFWCSCVQLTQDHVLPAQHKILFRLVWLHQNLAVKTFHTLYHICWLSHQSWYSALPEQT